MINPTNREQNARLMSSSAPDMPHQIAIVKVRLQDSYELD